MEQNESRPLALVPLLESVAHVLGLTDGRRQLTLSLRHGHLVEEPPKAEWKLTREQLDSYVIPAMRD